MSFQPAPHRRSPRTRRDASRQAAARAAALAIAASVAAGAAVALPVTAPPFRPANEPSRTPLEVAVGLPPHGWLVEQVAGERARVFSIVGPADNPHSYQPTDAQITRLARAVVFFRSGMPFEQGPWFRSLQASGALEIVDLRRGIELRAMEAHAHAGENSHDDPGHAEPQGDAAKDKDPHIWLSPRLLAVQARTVEAALAAADPDGAGHYRRRGQRFAQAMETLDAELAAELAPLSSSAFFVFHPAWGYFADAYGLEQIAIEIEGKQPSEAELTRLTRLAREHGARAVFVQPQIAGIAARAVAEAVGAELETLDPLARDVAANLRHVAARLRRSAAPLGEGPRTHGD